MQLSYYSKGFSFFKMIRNDKSVRLSDILKGVLNWILDLSPGKRRFEMCQRLYAKSDEELKSMGIKREEIAMRVFADTYYL